MLGLEIRDLVQVDTAKRRHVHQLWSDLFQNRIYTFAMEVRVASPPNYHDPIVFVDQSLDVYPCGGGGMSRLTYSAQKRASQKGKWSLLLYLIEV